MIWSNKFDKRKHNDQQILLRKRKIEQHESKTVKTFLHYYDYSCFVNLASKLKSNQIITESKNGYKLCNLVLRMNYLKP
jgi:hypothetical protein